MTPSLFARLYLATLPVFFAIDLVWLGLVAKRFYRVRLAGLLREDVQWAPALLFYLLYVAALLYFAVLPALERQSAGRAALLGAAFGFICYATYDLTNLALTRGFPVIVAVVDLAWGAAVSAAVAVAAYLISGQIR